MSVVVVAFAIWLIYTGHPLILLAGLAAYGLGLIVHGVLTAELHEEWDEELEAWKRQ